MPIDDPNNIPDQSLPIISEAMKEVLFMEEMRTTEEIWFEINKTIEDLRNNSKFLKGSEETLSIPSDFLKNLIG